MRRMFRITASGAGAILGMTLSCMILGFATGELSRPAIYQFPSGYRGWAQVFFQRPDCPSLSGRGVHLVIPVDECGMGCTSSPAAEGWQIIRYEYVAPDGTRTSLSGRECGALVTRTNFIENASS
jgi:hypothetical protein